MEIITRKQAREQGLTRYFNAVPCPKNHVAERHVASGCCITCRQEQRRKQKQLRPDLVAEQKRRWEQSLASKPQIKENRAQTMRNAAHQYSQSENGIAQRRETRRERYASDQAYRTRINIANRINELLGGRKNLCTLKLLGCSMEAATQHIAGQFAPEMNWDDRSAWHLDHIRPCASFDQTCPRQRALCWNWRNLQPLWAADNIAKSDSWTPEMEAEWAANMQSLGWEGELFLVFDQATAA